MENLIITYDTYKLNASWSDDSARYHVWFKIEYNKPVIEETIYKNPPLGVNRYFKGTYERDPKYFDTRMLNLNAKANEKVRERLNNITPEEIRQAEIKYELKKAEEQRMDEEIRRNHDLEILNKLAKQYGYDLVKRS